MNLLNNREERILFLESVVISILFGVAFSSWNLAILLLIAFLGLQKLKNSQVCLLWIISAFWSFIPMSIGYSFGGIVWASASGTMSLLWLVFMHKLNLKTIKNERQKERDKSGFGQSYRYLGYPNLN